MNDKYQTMQFSSLTLNLMEEKLFVLWTLKNSGLSKEKSLHAVCNNFLEDFFKKYWKTHVKYNVFCCRACTNQYCWLRAFKQVEALMWLFRSSKLKFYFILITVHSLQPLNFFTSKNKMNELPDMSMPVLCCKLCNCLVCAYNYII